eukprot:3161676-Rhodomonas_salina.1
MERLRRVTGLSVGGEELKGLVRVVSEGSVEEELRTQYLHSLVEAWRGQSSGAQGRLPAAFRSRPTGPPQSNAAATGPTQSRAFGTHAADVGLIPGVLRVVVNAKVASHLANSARACRMIEVNRSDPDMGHAALRQTRGESMDSQG